VTASSQLPVTERWAQFGPRKKSWLINVPVGGVCLSAFILASKNGAILLGLPRAGVEWEEQGGERLSGARELEKSNTWILPATHLLIGENPDDASIRIAREFTGLKGKPEFVMIQSHTRPAKLWFKHVGDAVHWDLCFVYHLEIDAVPKQLKLWWKEMRLFGKEEIRSLKIGRGHRDILKEGGYIK
jgi:ADP-ribose pyrophosphatase YjhB (NUDIX family)